MNIQSASANFESPTSVHPLYYLICQIFDDVDDVTELFLLSMDKLGSDYKDIAKEKNFLKFIVVLKDKYGMQFTVDYFENLLEYRNIHSHDGHIKFADKIRQYKEEKKLYLEKCWKEGGIRCDPYFVGRVDLIEEVVQDLNSDHCKGVVVCGLGGMGKTSLANEVCFRLKHQQSWNVVVVSQREKSDLSVLESDLVRALDEDTVPEAVSVIFLDNVDGYCETPEKLAEFCQFLRDILSLYLHKLLITVQRKLCYDQDQSNDRFNGLLKEHELKPFTIQETTKVLHKMTNISNMENHRIHELCCGSPMAVKTVGHLLREYISPDSMVSYLQHQTTPSVHIQLEKCIQTSLVYLKENIFAKDLEDLLIKLTVFQSAQFTLNAALPVCDPDSADFSNVSKMSNAKKIARENNLILRFTRLKAWDLLEIDNGNFSKDSRHQKQDKKQRYSLHPAVLACLRKKCSESDNCGGLLKEAKQRFMAYFQREAIKFGKEAGTSPIKAKRIIEENIIHFKQFFQMIIEQNSALSIDKVKERGISSNLDQYRKTWNVVKLVVSASERQRLAQTQAEIAKSERKLFDYMFWKCLEAINLIANDQHKLAEKLVDQLDLELGVASELGVGHGQSADFSYLATDWILDDHEKIPAVAKYHETKGQIYKAKKMYDRAVKFLETAEKIYDGNSIEGLLETKKDGERYYSHKLFLSEHASVLNAIGCLYFDMKNLTKAKAFHLKAEKWLQSLCNFEWLEKLAQCRHNIGACAYQEALATEDKNLRMMYLSEALIWYDKCIIYNENEAKEVTSQHLNTLRARAEVYYFQREVEKARYDIEKVISICEQLYQPPDVNLTLAYDKMGFFLYKLCRKKQKESDHAAAYQFLDKSIEFYEKTLHHIKMGGLPIDHKGGQTFRSIKEMHIRVIKMRTHDQSKIRECEQQYQELIMGDMEDGDWQNRDVVLGNHGDGVVKMETDGEAGVMATEEMDPGLDTRMDEYTTEDGVSFADKNTMSVGQDLKSVGKPECTLKKRIFSRQQSIHEDSISSSFLPDIPEQMNQNEEYIHGPVVFRQKKPQLIESMQCVKDKVGFKVSGQSRLSSGYSISDSDYGTSVSSDRSRFSAVSLGGEKRESGRSTGSQDSAFETADRSSGSASKRRHCWFNKEFDSSDATFDRERRGQSLESYGSRDSAFEPDSTNKEEQYRRASWNSTSSQLSIEDMGQGTISVVGDVIQVTSKDAKDKRASWAIAGSQDSITSQLRRLLRLSTESFEEEEKDRRARKKLKKSGKYHQGSF